MSRQRRHRMGHRKRSSLAKPKLETGKAAADQARSLGPVLDMLRLIWAVDHGLQKTSKRMEAELGITGPQRFVIRLVGRFRSITAAELSGLMMMHRSVTSRIVTKLERRGFIERTLDRADRRRALLRLTAKGRAKDVDAAGTIEGALKRVLPRIPAREIRSTGRVLARVASALEDGEGR